ncbi:MAG TPA: 4-hydroxy-tetrahydrodipicolinate reductase, partial [Burkholderiales bacterium]
MIRIAIAGAAGRMGRTLIEAITAARGMQLCAAIEYPGSPAVGTDAGTMAGVAALGVDVTSDIAAGDFDVLVEFTRPEPTLEHLDYCVKH